MSPDERQLPVARHMKGRKGGLAHGRPPETRRSRRRDADSRQNPPPPAEQQEAAPASAIQGKDSSYRRKRAVALTITVLVGLSIPALILALVLLG